MMMILMDGVIGNIKNNYILFIEYNYVINA